MATLRISNRTTMIQNKKKNFIVKYRKSIVESMSEEKVLQYGFDRSYKVFERSINNMQKEGDSAELMAVEYLKEKKMLSENFRTNQVIALNRIKIEADIIDYDNKIVYETKSRKTGELAKNAIKDKWRTFEFDKNFSNYQDYKFVGIIVANYPDGQIVKGLATFDNSKIDHEKMEEKFSKHFKRINHFKGLKK